VSDRETTTEKERQREREREREREGERERESKETESRERPSGALAHDVAVEGVEDALVGQLQRVEQHHQVGRLHHACMRE
jgi:hypothetical protein